MPTKTDSPPLKAATVMVVLYMTVDQQGRAAVAVAGPFYREEDQQGMAIALAGRTNVGSIILTTMSDGELAAQVDRMRPKPQ